MHIKTKRVVDHIMQKLYIKITSEIKFDHGTRAMPGDPMIDATGILQAHGTKGHSETSAARKHFKSMENSQLLATARVSCTF